MLPLIEQNISGDLPISTEKFYISFSIDTSQEKRLGSGQGFRSTVTIPTHCYFKDGKCEYQGYWKSLHLGN